MSMSKKKLRIGDLAKELKIKKYVIRFWEKEFDLESDRSQGGQRFYTTKDLDVFTKIKNLLYNQGFTISGAKKQLKTRAHAIPVIHEKSTDITGSEAKQEHRSESKLDQNIIAATKEPDFTVTEHEQKHKEFMLRVKELKLELVKLEKLLQ